MSYKFIKTKSEDNQFDKTNVTIELPHNEVSLDDMFELFEDFLKACGFNLKGRVDIIEDELATTEDVNDVLGED